MKKTGLIIVTLACTLLLFIHYMRGHKEAKNEIRIGVILPLTGFNSFRGQTCKDGLDLAVKNINQEQSNYIIKVIYADSRSSSKDALSAYKKLRSSGIDYFVGFGIHPLLAYIQETNKEDFLFFEEKATNMNLSSLSDNCFHLFPNADMITDKVVSFYREKGITKAGVVFLQNEVYSLHANYFSQKIKSDTITISVFEGYEPNTRDFKDIVNKFIGKDIELLYLIGDGISNALFLRQLYDNPKTSNIPVVGDMSLNNSSYLELIGEVKAPIYIVDSYISTDFIQKYHNEYGTHPDAYGAYAYAIPYILLTSFNALHGNTRPQDIHAYIINHEFNTVVGTIKFDKETREPELKLIVNTVK